VKTFRIVALIVAAAGLSACGSSAVASSTPASPSPSPSAVASHSKLQAVDPCTLVTAQDASSAAGRTLINDVALGAAKITGGCFYGARGSSTGVYIYMQLYPDAATADAVTVEQFQSVMAGELGSPANTWQDVSGIGDRAYEFTAKGNAGSGIAILVYKGNVVFLVAMEPTTNEGAVEGLAKTAAGRLH
jgi:hypothetical protein